MTKPMMKTSSEVRIVIDGKDHTASAAKLTGKQIRLMAEVPDSFDLYVQDEMADYDDSREVADNEILTLADGLRFFTADPKDI